LVVIMLTTLVVTPSDIRLRAAVLAAFGAGVAYAALAKVHRTTEDRPVPDGSMTEADVRSWRALRAHLTLAAAGLGLALVFAANDVRDLASLVLGLLVGMELQRVTWLRQHHA
jgi:hypothetical protein